MEVVPVEQTLVVNNRTDFFIEYEHMQLSVGDYVTHIDHGVGRFGGLHIICLIVLWDLGKRRANLQLG
jgi:transcription-repair coupling factor (superfamily II helicase)